MNARPLLVEFILEQHANIVVQLAKTDEQLGRLATHQARNEARFEKRLDGVHKLLLIGAKQLNALAVAQRNTDRKLNRFIDSLSRSRTNGRPRQR